MKYLGRYLNRPPVSASWLRQYNDAAVVHHYLDHRTGKHKRQTLSQEDMIGRYISQVPARHFKMERYSGFVGTDQYQCILCKSRLHFTDAVAGSTPQKCSLTGCIRWRKSDGCGCLSWIGTPEKQFSG